MKNYVFKEKYNHLIQELINDIRKTSVYYTGPDCIILLEELCKKMDLKPGMKILDMGCGAGFTSIILAKEFGVTVFAADLWFNPTGNYERFVKVDVSDKVFPIKAEVRAMPFANNFFDAAISIDAYHYFGTDECFLSEHYAKLVKKSGQFGIVNPGLTREFKNGLPEKMMPHWEPDMYSWHSARWWEKLWQKTGLVDVTYASEIPDGKAIWCETADFDLHHADEENYLTLMMMSAVKK